MVMFTKLSQTKLSNVLLNNYIAFIEPSFSSLETTLRGNEASLHDVWSADPYWLFLWEKTPHLFSL